VSRFGGHTQEKTPAESYFESIIEF
jgi:hypothetical protein